jgi:hypothetical protein
MTDKHPADEQLHRRETADEAEERREHEATEEATRQQAHLGARQKLVDHDRRVRRFLLRLSLANWGIAVGAWTISAFLGITSPASIIVYSVLFVIGLVAAILAILTYLVEKFGHEPALDAPESADAPAAAGSAGDAPAATAS